VVEEGARDGVSVVGEGLSGSGRRGLVVDGSETAINVAESQGNATLMGVDNIVEGGLGAARKGGEGVIT
jgi:hypothetical protein